MLWSRALLRRSVTTVKSRNGENRLVSGFEPDQGDASRESQSAQRECPSTLPVPAGFAPGEAGGRACASSDSPQLLSRGPMDCCQVNAIGDDGLEIRPAKCLGNRSRLVAVQ